MSSLKTVSVQPWFTAIENPAQSTLNTAKALGERRGLAYLVSAPRADLFEPIVAGIAKYDRVLRFRVPGDSLRMGTLLAVARCFRGRGVLKRRWSYIGN